MTPRQRPVKGDPEYRSALHFTQPARQGARLRYAKERVQKIIDGNPPFSEDQLMELSAMFRDAARGAPRDGSTEPGR